MATTQALFSATDIFHASKCGAKKRYSTKRNAKIAVKRLQNVGFGIQRVYKCRVCMGFHLTTQGKDNGKA